MVVQAPWPLLCFFICVISLTFIPFISDGRVVVFPLEIDVLYYRLRLLELLEFIVANRGVLWHAAIDVIILRCPVVFRL